MKHLDLFSGIGGFALAARWMGWQTKAFCDSEPYCQKLLKQNFPDTPVYEDIRTIPKIGNIDIITGGFPCQPFSQAGKQVGKKDNRYLWPEMLRVIEQEKPAWVVGENVAGIVNLALDQVLTDLEAEDYATQSFVIPACAVDAPHRRDRVWIIANANSAGQQPSQTTGNKAGDNFRRLRENVADASSKRLEGSERQEHEGRGKGLTASGEILADAGSSERKGCAEKPLPRQPDLSREFGRSSQNLAPRWATEPSVGRVAHGIPKRVDRIKGLGNAIVPQVAHQIFKHIERFLNE